MMRPQDNPWFGAFVRGYAYEDTVRIETLAGIYRGGEMVMTNVAFVDYEFVGDEWLAGEVHDGGDPRTAEDPSAFRFDIMRTAEYLARERRVQQERLKREREFLLRQREKLDVDD